MCDVIHEGKNWVNCAILTGNRAGLRSVFSSRLSHTHRTAQFTQGIPQFPQFNLPTPRWHHLKAHPFPAIHSADQHRTIYSFPNTTSYCTFYAFFSSFRITLWPMLPANSKRQPCFYPPQSHVQEDTQNWQTWWETCAVTENIQFSFPCSFCYTVNLQSLT